MEEEFQIDPAISYANFRHIIDNIPNRRVNNADHKDASNHPSYTTFEVPYHMKCRERYNRCKEMYEKQFQHEIRQHLTNQATAYEEARLNRHLCITTLWPPLHNRHEIIHTQRYFFRLSRKQRIRLNYLMSCKID